MNQALRFRGKDNSVLLDCDGVLLDWFEGFRHFGEAVLGRPICAKGPTEYSMYKWLGLETAEECYPLIDRFNSGENGTFAELPALPGARETLHALHEAGREIHVITSCSRDAKIVEMRTRNLLAAFGDIFSEIHCLDMQECKSALLGEYRRSIWVEDKLENAVIGAQLGHHSYLIRTSYNIEREPQTQLDGLVWVDGWSDIRDAELMAA